jgi:phosphoribosylformylglycinamidine cyclo-ligase
MVHCSGGAQTKVMHFVKDVHVIKDNLFPIPPLFDMIQKESGTSFKEMYQVFNMGHRMEIYLNPKHAGEVIQIAQSFGIPAQIVGYVEGHAGKKLTIRNQGEEYIYE